MLSFSPYIYIYLTSSVPHYGFYLTVEWKKIKRTRHAHTTVAINVIVLHVYVINTLTSEVTR